MIANNDIDALAGTMAQRRESDADTTRGTGSGDNSLVLFLGAACGRAAGVPSVAQMARSTFDAVRESDADGSSDYFRGVSPDDEQGLVDAFYEMMDDLSALQRHSLLHSFFATLAVPAFYQDMVRLIKAGFFRLILTTGIDTLVEKALDGVGPADAVPYRVLNLGVRREIGRGPGEDFPGVTVIKLHGDVTQKQFAITPDQIYETLRAQRGFFKAELASDLVMVGYEFESPPLHDVLARTPGDLWWVAPERPPEDKFFPMVGQRAPHFVDGEAGTPQAFFGQLALRLLEHAQQAAAQGPLRSDDPQAAYLQEQLNRARALLFKLELGGMSARQQSPDQQQAQIVYQRQLIASLEDQLRTLSSSRPRIAEAADQIARAAEKSKLDPATRNYLQEQVKFIVAESSQEQPNQFILSAAINATLTVADRLGDELDSDSVRELSAYVAGSSGRRA